MTVGPELFSLMPGGPQKEHSLIATALYCFFPLSTLSGQCSHVSLSPAVTVLSLRRTLEISPPKASSFPLSMMDVNALHTIYPL